MPATRKVSVKQLEELVAWMETHPLQVRGNQSVFAKRASDSGWKELAPRLNAIGDGVSKTAKEWRQYWSDIKCKAKKRWSVMQQNGSGIDGGPWDDNLTPIEDRILSLMGVGNANGRIKIYLEDSPSVPALSHPRLSPLPSTSDDLTPTVEAAPPPASPPPAALLQPSPPQSRPSKRKHGPGPGAGKSIPNTDLPQWELEDSRNCEEGLEERWLELDERPLELDERPLELDERRLELNEWRLGLDQRRLEMNERRLELEERRLELEERRLELEERRLKLDRRRMAREDRAEGGWCGGEMQETMACEELTDAEEEQRLIKLNIARRRQQRAEAQPLLLPDNEFQERFRVSKATFATLCEDIIPFLPTIERSTGIKPEIKVLAALYFYATGSYQSSVGDNDVLHLGQTSTSESLQEVTDALNRPEILRKYIKFPHTQTDRDSVAKRFNNKFGFPGVIGCIDRTHVAIIKPREDEKIYYNRKGYHSLNCLVICDADLRILFVDASFGGASRDTHVWNMSPVNAALSKLHDEGQVYWLLGDSGYAQCQWMMTPILSALPNSPEANYSAVHERTRSVVERTLGLLKSRFRCLLAHRTLHYTPRKAAQIVNACVVLHNLIDDPNFEVDSEAMQSDAERQPPPLPVPAPADDDDRQRVVIRLWRNRR